MSDASVSKSIWPTAAAVIGVFVIFLLIMTIARRPALPLDQIPSAPEEEQWKFSNQGRADRLAELKGKEQTQATTYKWLDQEAGVVQVPIERAMELTIAELSAQR